MKADENHRAIASAARRPCPNHGERSALGRARVIELQARCSAHLLDIVGDALGDLMWARKLRIAQHRGRTMEHVRR